MVLTRAELFFEGFAGGGRGATKPINSSGDGNGVLTGATAGAVGGALLSGGSAASMSMSNTGSDNVEKCPLTDETLYCQISRTAGIAGMLVYIFIIIILVIGVLYAIYYLFFRSGGSNVIKASRRGR